MKEFSSLVTFILFTISLTFSQSVENNSVLSVEQIMQGERFVGFVPQGISWSEDSQEIYFSWNPEMDTIRSPYRLDITTGEPIQMSYEGQRNRVTAGSYNSDFTKKIFSKNGDLYLLDLNSYKKTQLTHTLDREYSPGFNSDDTKVHFTKNQNVYTWNLDSGQLIQLTNFKKGAEPKKHKSSEFEDWLSEDQLELIDILDLRDAKQKIRSRRGDSLEVNYPSPVYYGSSSISNIQTSPDLSYVTFLLTDRANAKRTKVPDFVTDDAYVEDLNSRPKVGSPEDSYKMGIYNIAKDTSYFLDLTTLEGIMDKAAFLSEYHRDTIPFEGQYEEPKSVYFSGPFFSKGGKAFVVIRSLDNKDRWIALINLEDGSLKTLDWQHDDAWIGGPGISGWNFSSGNVGWTHDDQHVWYQSEVTGFSHLYVVNIETKEKEALTSGNFEIHNVTRSRYGDQFYIIANAEGPHERHLYTFNLEDKKLQKLTSNSGRYEFNLSPNESHFALRYSYSNKPWELYLLENKPGAKMRQLTKSTTKAFEGYNWRVPEIVWFEANDGEKVPARLYKPKKQKRKGPAVIFVHGAGYLQNVHHWWSSYYREYMFHNLLADNGYTVLDIDFRASEGYGRDWRTAIYRHMGGRDLDDQIDGIKYLIDHQKVSPNRIGMYGGSYGGFITLMTLLKYPGVIQCGAALRSVTDWAHYNHPYTSNILNTPLEDEDAYKRSSPIYFADGLQDHLVMLHGMVDTNVQFKDVVRLSQRFIELGKDNWELAVFPMEGHGFVEASSWADEYKRIFKLFQQHLK